MPARPTTPHIAQEQNNPGTHRYLRAARVTYTKAKKRAAVRIWFLVAVTIALCFVTARHGDSELPLGLLGIALVMVDLAARQMADRTTTRAVAFQEQFDTKLFNLPWNNYTGITPATTAEVTEAAASYSGEPVDGWYPDTRTVERPLDVLICQTANVVWGRSAHRKWAVLLALALLLAYVGAALLYWREGSTLNHYVLTFVLPTLGLGTEGLMQISDHLGLAAEKKELERQVDDTWTDALVNGGDDANCRSIQDQMVRIRRSPAQVPDWFHHATRTGAEANMQAVATAMIVEATSHNRA